MTSGTSSTGQPTNTPTTTVIVGGARTPIGRFMGGLSSLSAADLGGKAIAAALERSGVQASDVDQVVMGQVLTAGAGQIPARQAAVKGGISMNVPATTVNKVCLSGTSAIGLADALIRAGAAEVIVAGGMESMSQAPHLLRSGRAGQSFGDIALSDHMEKDGLWDAFTDQGMGPLTEAFNTGDVAVTREESDAVSAASHQRAAAAWERGDFADEVVPVEVPQRRGEPLVVSQDEGIRVQTTAESLGKLRPAFTKDGVLTAGSSSQISDGAAAVVLMSKERAEREGLTWLAEIVGYATVAGPDSSLQLQPANAIKAVCERAGVEVTDLDIVEINEAFSAVGIASTRSLGVDPEKVNPDGGAIALGHPIGASGARLVLHVANVLARQGSGSGVVALCGGGGQGDAVLLRR